MSLVLKELDLGKIKLSNRLVFPPMATSKSLDGMINKAMVDYYDEKSKSGLGLIIIEHSYINLSGKADNGQVSVAEDKTVDGLKKVAEVIQKNGAKAIMQINHAGSMTSKKKTGLDVIAPSAVVNPRAKEIPIELSLEAIEEIKNDFVNAAKRCKEAGFDGVELHSAHGYLLNQFYSPLTNKREDRYGGDLLRRVQLHIEVIKAVREVVGEDHPIFLRLGACDYLEGGSEIEDAVLACRIFENAGVDVLDISGGHSGYMVKGLNNQGYFQKATEAIKKEVNIPVILTGGVTKIKEAEKLLKEGKADLIGVGRAVLKDSDWMKKELESFNK